MIYICIPAHNEEQTVGVVLWKIRQVMAEYPRDYQLLVVDDASTDKTPEVLSPYARVLPLTVVRTESRQGEGGAVEMMLREAVRRSEYPKRDAIITLQADFTQEPDELVSLIKRVEAGADIVAGQTKPGADVSIWVRWARRLALRLLGRSRVPPGVADPFTGYRAYRVSVVKGALADRGGRLVHWGGWAGAAELLLATAPHARRIDTVDLVERRERLQRPSRLRPFRALRDVWSLARESRPLQVSSPAELDEAMRSVAAVRTSEVTLRSGDRAERTQRGERPRGTSEERRARDPERARRSAGASGSGRAAGGERTAPGDRPARRERPARPDKPATARRGGESAPERSRQEAARPEQPAPAGEQGTSKAEGGRSRERRSRSRAVEPRPAEPALAAAEPVLEPVGGGNGAPPPVEPGEKTRRKRPRRRKRGTGGGAERAGAPAAAAGTAQDQPDTESGQVLPGERATGAEWDGSDPAMFTTAAGPADGELTAAGAEAASAGGPGSAAENDARSRRRRRGRRGGRRRPAATGGAAEAGEAVSTGEASVAEARPTAGEDVPAGHAPAAAARPEPSGQMGIFELIEGDRSSNA